MCLAKFLTDFVPIFDEIEIKWAQVFAFSNN